jgi:hypothetical protein
MESTLPTQDRYPLLVATAERAVAKVTDPDLKKIAFGKVLDDLLNASTHHAGGAGLRSSIPLKKTRTTVRRRNGKKQLSPSLVKDLDLRPDGKPSLREFYADKKPSTNQQICTVFVYYLSKILNVPRVTVRHVFTCYKDIAGLKVPEALIQVLRDTASLKGWLDTSDTESIEVTTSGENFVNFDLPPAVKKPK